jgi:hypothetical protein
VITYIMPVVALFLGVGLLGERLTVGAIAGLILIAFGAWLATGTPQVRCWRACVDVGLAIEGLRRDRDHDQAGTEGSAARGKRLTAVDNSSPKSVFHLDLG